MAKSAASTRTSGLVKTTAKTPRSSAGRSVSRTATERTAKTPVKAKKRPSVGRAVRAEIEELTVRADLAGMDLRDGLVQRLETAENAWLAARHRLEIAVADAERALGSMRALLTDLLQVPADADQVISRSHRRS